jgi:hypothetical protein
VTAGNGSGNAWLGLEKVLVAFTSLKCSCTTGTHKEKDGEATRQATPSRKGKVPVAGGPEAKDYSCQPD